MNAGYKQKPVIVRALKQGAFWVFVLAGLMIAGVVFYFLDGKTTQFLTREIVLTVSGVVALSFTAMSLFLCVQFIKRTDDRRNKKISARWIVEGSRFEDVNYKALLNATTDIIFEVGKDGNLAYMNVNYTKLTEIPTEDQIGRNIFDLFHPQQREKNIDRFEKFVAGKLKPYRVFLNMENFDGSYRMVELSFRILSKNLEDKTNVIGTIVDRESQQQDRHAAKEAEKKYRDIFENAVNGIYQTTPDGKFVSLNPAMARILGYKSVNEVMETVHSIASQIYVRPEDRALFKAEMDKAGRVQGLEVQMYAKDGRKIWIIENARAVPDKNGNIAYYEGTVLDVTERKRTEQELKQAKLAAEMSSRTKTEFLANMSHELRTPLNAIIGFSEIIKDEIMGPIENDSYREYAGDIYNGGNALLNIISEILEVSKIEAGNRELNESPVKLSRAVSACLVILQGKIDEHELNVHVEVPDTLPELIGEELVIKQILLNLVSNAVKFTPANGDIHIRAFIQDTSGNMVLEVQDNGIGMSGEELEKSTQPFWQANSSLARDISGTGLGLTLVKSLAGLHGATLQLESEREKGTTARILFPEQRVIPKAGEAA